MNKTLIIYASFGRGHETAANALSSLIGSPCKDLLDFSHPIVKDMYSSIYMITTQYFPNLWQGAFSLAKRKTFAFAINMFHRILFYPFLKYLKKSDFKIIIVTHFFPSHLIDLAKNGLDIQVVSVITDVRVHPFWVSKAVDYYFAALSITKEDLMKLGVNEKKIVTGYVPLREGFLQENSQKYLRKKFNLDLKPVVMFMSSSRGKFPFLKDSIRLLLRNFNVFIIYGKNKKLKKYLDGIDSPNIRTISFCEYIWDIVSLSSVIITKPGGLTIFEGVYERKPFIFTHYIPGQEKENMDFLIKHGVAKFVQNKTELINAINSFTEKSDELKDNYPIKISHIKQPLIEMIQNSLTSESFNQIKRNN